ncbi:MAG: hypothetical protein ILO36_02230, partial [Abditibacteriota bacterium]|nr:hypothetical protein [Abditibacteriota bacterium]
MKFFRFYIIFVLILASAAVLGQGKVTTNAIYQDSKGVRYEWKIMDSGNIIWDGIAYTPCGVRVVFSSLASPEITELTQEDKAAISALTAAGADSVIITNGYQLTNSNPEMLQQIMDLLDGAGIRYGIELGEETNDPLSGFIIDPARYRIDGPYPDKVITEMWKDVDSGLFMVVNKSDETVIESGVLEVNANGQSTIRLERSLDADSALLVYPHVTRYGSFDIWEGYDDLRDTVISYFSKVRPGEGLRFFYNPVNASKLAFAGEDASFVPDSAKFSLEFEGYLTKKHFHNGMLAHKWGISPNLPQISDYLKLLPLWAQLRNASRGLGQMYDSATGKNVRANTNGSYWQDLTGFRNDSVREYMSSMGDVLRKNVANVPIIYSAERGIVNQTYLVSASPSSPDGFAYACDAEDRELGLDICLLYNLNTSYPKTTWIAAVNPGMPAESLINLGYKGFFFDYNGGAGVAKANEFKNKCHNIQAYRPNVIEYPASSEIGLTPILLDEASHTYWLPSPKAADVVRFGEDVFGYNILGTSDYVIWAAEDNKQVTFPGIKNTAPKIVFPGNAEIKKAKSTSKKSNPLYTVTLGTRPVVMKNISFSLFFPKETAEQEIEKMERVVKAAPLDDETERKLRDLSVKNIKEVLKNGAFNTAYGMAKEIIAQSSIVSDASLWIESSTLKRTGFTGFRARSGASDGTVLLLDEPVKAPLTEYYASMTINAEKNKSYTMWIAMSKNSVSSPVEISNSGSPWMTPDTSTERPYGDGLAWYKVGTASLYEGPQTINIKVTGPAETGQYYVAIDAILLVSETEDFTPDG